MDDEAKIAQLLIDQELASRPSKQRFQIDPEEFGSHAADAMSDARYVDGRIVLRLVLESLLRNPTAKGKNSGSARLARISAELFDQPKRGGRPRRQTSEALRIVAEQVLKRRDASSPSIVEIASAAVEEVLGQPDEGLAETVANDFSANRAEILADYVDSRYPHIERRIARLIVDLLAACGLDVDPLVTAPITTDPHLGRERTFDDIEDDYAAYMEALARRD